MKLLDEGYFDLDVGSLPGAREETIDDPVFGGNAYLLTAGPEDGEAVVLCHGVGDIAARDWNGLLPELAQKYRVLAFDLPGFGRSTKANELYGPEGYAKFIKHVAASRIDGPFNLIGHSMGAAICLGFAGTYPAEVKRLILADAAGILHRHAFGEYLMHLGFTGGVPGLDKIKKNRFGKALGAAFSVAFGETAEKFAHQVIRPYFSVEPNPAIFFQYAKMRRKLLGGDPMKIAGLMLVTHNFGEAISNVEAPPLLIWGKDDKIAPLRTGYLIESLIPGSRLEPLDECGHVVMKDQREKFNSLVLDYLERDPPSVIRALPSSSSDRPDLENLRMRGEKGRTIEGAYNKVTLKGCKDMVLHGVSAKQIELGETSAQLIDCRIVGDDIGLDAADSKAKITGGSIEADVAVWTEECDLDLAGTRIRGRRAAFRTGYKGQVLFSVCPVKSPKNDGFLHGVYPVSPEEDI